MFAREIVTLSQSIKGRFRVYLDLPGFINETYPWIPFTLALHAIILAPECCVYFCNINPIDYSNLIDKKRREKPFWGHSEPLHCIRNFVCYLCTKTGDRSGRVFEQTKTGIFVPFKERIMGKVDTSGFDEYFKSYVENPYPVRKEGYWDPQYFTHPFDHLPVKNLTKSLKMSYMTGPQLKAKKTARSFHRRSHLPARPDRDRHSAALLEDSLKTTKKPTNRHEGRRRRRRPAPMWLIKFDDDTITFAYPEITNLERNKN